METMNTLKSMKRIRKILSLVCICGLLLVVPKVPASDDGGEGEPEVTVAFHNLAFANQVYILYAVDVANAGTEDVKPFMQFWTEEPDLTADPNPERRAESLAYRALKDIPDGKDYYIFAYSDLTAQMMADVIYARAGVEIGGKTYYSELDDYSVCEYAAYQLGVIPGCLASDNEDLKAMLRSMLDYGTNAQRYFQYRTDCLANEFYLTFGDGIQVPTEGIQYEIQGNTATVTGYAGTDDKLVIAATYQGKPVTAIGKEALKGGTFTEAVIPAGVTSIGEAAFEDCKALERIEIPETVTTLGNILFQGCPKVVIYYGGTVDQLEKLLKSNEYWNMDDKIPIKFQDGSEYLY